MSVWGVLRILARRWYVVVPILAVGCVLAYMQGKKVMPTYEAQAYVTLQGPTKVVQPVPGTTSETKIVPVNPLLSGSGSGLAPEAAKLELIETSAIARQDAINAGVAPGYTVGSTSRSSVMVIDIKTSSPERSLASIQFAIGHIKKTLDADQQGFLNDPTSRVTLQTLVPPEVVGVTTSGKTRIEAVVALGGAVLAVACALLLEALLIGLGRRRDRRHGGRRAGGRAAGAADSQGRYESSAFDGSDHADEVDSTPLSSIHD